MVEGERKLEEEERKRTRESFHCEPVLSKSSRDFWFAYPMLPQEGIRLIRAAQQKLGEHRKGGDKHQRWIRLPKCHRLRPGTRHGNTSVSHRNSLG